MKAMNGMSRRDRQALRELIFDMACESMACYGVVGHDAMGPSLMGIWGQPHLYNRRVFNEMTYTESTG